MGKTEGTRAVSSGMGDQGKKWGDVEEVDL